MNMNAWPSLGVAFSVRYLFKFSLSTYLGLKQNRKLSTGIFLIHLSVIQMYYKIYQCPFHSSMSSAVTNLLSYVRFSSTCMAAVLLAWLTSFPLGGPSFLHSALHFQLVLAFFLTLWPWNSYPRYLSSLQETEFLSFCLIISKSTTGIHVSF